LGGVGVPGGGNTDWLPPGHFLSCDADSAYVYVAWPDTRTYISGQNKTEIYFRRGTIN
jgi:hypothetical protein